MVPSRWLTGLSRLLDGMETVRAMPPTWEWRFRGCATSGRPR
jgi:hypothetical protein